MSHALLHIMDAAESLLDGKHRRTMKNVARSGIEGGGRMARRAFSVLRHIHLADVLAWVHLSRRRGPLGAIALLGAGAAVGAGLVMLLSPRSGSETRSTLRRRVSGLEERARSKLQGLTHLEERAAGAVKDVERKVEESVSEALQKAREAAKGKPA